MVKLFLKNNRNLEFQNYNLKWL